MFLTMNDVNQVPEIIRNDLFKELPAKRRRYLESRLKRVEFSAGTQVIKKGRSGQFLGILERGRVMQENGRSHTRSLKTGQSFGSEMLRFGKPSASTITTQTNTVIWVLNRTDWLAPSSPPQPRTTDTGKPRFKRAGWISMITTLILATIMFTLGPILLEYANDSIPNLMVESGRTDLAEGYLRLVLQWQPESARLHGKLGDNLALQGKEQEAITAYQQAITLDEYLPWIHNNLGVLLLEQDEAYLASDHFLKALNLNPENTDAYRNLGNAYYSLKEWGAAANAYQMVLDLDSSLIDVKAEWASMILYESQLKEARDAWEEVLLDKPRHQLALQGLGVISLLEKDPTQALLYLDAARYFNPDNLTTRLYIGLAQEALDRPEEAAAEYQFVKDKGSEPELFSLADTLLEVVQEQSEPEIIPE